MSSEDRLNERFRAKLEARVTGVAPAFVIPPEMPQGESRDAIDARFRLKLANHAPAPKPSEPSENPAPVVEDSGSEPAAPVAAPVPDPPSEPAADKPKNKR